VRWLLSTLLTFFVGPFSYALPQGFVRTVEEEGWLTYPNSCLQAKTYDEVFGFKTGPPLHDALCIAVSPVPSSLFLVLLRLFLT
jgi:hypothetical protein